MKMKKMEVLSKYTRKVISQIITVYQGTLEVELPEVGIKLLIKPNKDVDDMLDVVNDELIKVCGEYLDEHKLGLDKYQLATVCAQLTTLAMERCEDPFFINVKTSKALVKDYLEKNKSKREALERIKQENDNLDKELALQKKEQQEKKKVYSAGEVIVDEKPEMPSENLEAGSQGTRSPASKPKKKVTRGTDALAISDFRLPI